MSQADADVNFQWSVGILFRKAITNDAKQALDELAEFLEIRQASVRECVQLLKAIAEKHQLDGRRLRIQSIRKPRDLDERLHKAREFVLNRFGDEKVFHYS